MPTDIKIEKLYFLGMCVGAATISGNNIVLNLPFNKWGLNPKRMNAIARDLLVQIKDVIAKAYSIDLIYKIGSSGWALSPAIKGDLSLLKKDLLEYGLPTDGVLLNAADLKIVKSKLSSSESEHFLSGIFDSRASLEVSHRRFNSSAPIVSVEIPGSTENFNFVMQFCSWMTDLGSVTDQILYNHPSQHSGSNPTYKNWKKGFKIRLLIGSFVREHSFFMISKSAELPALEKKQKTKEQLPCEKRLLNHVKPVSVHEDLDSPELPEVVRGKVFFHYHHVCAALGCPHAPITEVKKLLKKANTLVSIFPILVKETDVTNPVDFFRKFSFSDFQVSKRTAKIKSLLADEDFMAKYGVGTAIAFLFSPKLNGKRHVGNMSLILNASRNDTLVVIRNERQKSNPICLYNSTNDRIAVLSPRDLDTPVTIDGFAVKVKR